MSAKTATAPVRPAARTAQPDPDKLQSFLGKVLDDFGASLSSGLVFIGMKLGLYDAMADGEPVTPEELAQKAKISTRYAAEWLVNQAAGGYVAYDPAGGRYVLPPEQRTALTDASSPFYVGGGFYVVKAMLRAQERIAEAFRDGGGMRWGEHDPDLFVGTERFFRPGYAAHLVTEWIPAMAGIDVRLREGGKVADVGCGHGASTIILAKAYPRSRVFGFDNHGPSVEHARAAAARENAGNAAFEIADATRFPGENYDLICFFDCLHDMGDPVGSMKRAAQTLAPDGSVLIVEPMAGEAVEENFNPVGRTYSAASTLCCTPNSLAYGGPALGAVAPESALRRTAEEAGFGSFVRVAQTPFNRVFEARRL